MTQTTLLLAKVLHESTCEYRVQISRIEVEHTVSWVVNGNDDARSQDNLLPGLANVDNVDTIGPGLPQVRLHVHLEVFCAEVTLGSEEHLNILLGGVEDRGEVAGSHLDGLALQKLVVIEKWWCCVQVELLVEGIREYRWWVLAKSG